MDVERYEVDDRVRSKASGQTGTITRKPAFRDDYYTVTWDTDSVRFGAKVSKISPLSLTHNFERVS
jgi:hypothetical protein